MSEQQIKLVYVPQRKEWKLHVQWGRVNGKGSFFLVEHSKIKYYEAYTEARDAVENYMIYAPIPAKPAVPPIATTTSTATAINTQECMSELDIELMEMETMEYKE